MFTYLYLVYGVLVIYRYRHTVSKYLSLPAMLFMLPIFLGSALQYLCYGVSLVWLGVAIALCSLYINVQSEMFYNDMLSGLLNRQYMNHYLEAELKRTRSHTTLAGIMLDIDRFKSINDGYGHLTGDDAIKTVGRLLRECAQPRDVVVRFAGDEFIMFQQVGREEDVQESIRRIRARAEEFNRAGKAPYRLDFSIGYALLDRKEDTVNSFLGRMDAAMYADKRSRIRESVLPDRREEGAETGYSAKETAGNTLSL